MKPSSAPSDFQKDPSIWRKDFPIFDKQVHGNQLIYFDHAATAQKPKPVIDAISAFYLHQYGTVHRAAYSLSAHSTQNFQSVRKKVQKFLNASSENEIIFTRGATESINLVASCFGQGKWLKPGDEILITEMEHHANIVPWQLVAKKAGATLRVAPILDDGSLDLAAFTSLLCHRTKMVAIAHIANTTGIINPIRTIVQESHRVGAAVLVDGAQAVSHIPVDVQELDADFYVFSGHKMYGPTGVGVLYGKQHWLEALPPYQGGGDMIQTVSWEETTYQPAPLKFEAGTPMIAEVIGLGAAIDYIESIGLAVISLWEKQLFEEAMELLTSIPKIQFIGAIEEKAPIIQFYIPGLHPLDIGLLLDSRGIAIRTGHHCAQPFLRRFGLSASCRVSFGLYNLLEEVHRFVSSLHEIRKLLS